MAEVNQLRAKLRQLQANTNAARAEDLGQDPSGNTASIDGSVAQGVVRALISIEYTIAHKFFFCDTSGTAARYNWETESVAVYKYLTIHYVIARNHE